MSRGLRILGAAMAALVPACGGGHGSGTPAFTVTLTEPSAGRTFTAPATIPLRAVAPGSVATDSRGNLYTGETFEGKRVQKFTPRR